MMSGLLPCKRLLCRGGFHVGNLVKITEYGLLCYVRINAQCHFYGGMAHEILYSFYTHTVVYCVRAECVTQNVRRDMRHLWTVREFLRVAFFNALECLKHEIFAPQTVSIDF